MRSKEIVGRARGISLRKISRLAVSRRAEKSLLIRRRALIHWILSRKMSLKMPKKRHNLLKILVNSLKINAFAMLKHNMILNSLFRNKPWCYHLILTIKLEILIKIKDKTQKVTK